MKALLPFFLIALIATSQAATKAALPPMPTTPPGSSAILLGTESVQKELKLTSLQRAVIDDIRSEYRDDARAITAKVAAGQEAKPQALAALQALTASAERRALRALNDKQKKRLEEIRYQLLGGYMLLQPKLQAQLGLNDKQKAKIGKIWARGETYALKVNAEFEQGKISFQQRLVDLRANRLDRSDDFIALLTSQQYAKFVTFEGEGFSE